MYKSPVALADGGATPTSMARRMEAELVPTFDGRAPGQGDRFVYVGGEAKKSAECCPRTHRVALPVGPSTALPLWSAVAALRAMNE